MLDINPPDKLHANTIAEVIASLDRIVEWSKANNQCTGYFAALYRKVTIKVKEGIEQGHFEDGARMERLDVIFANRYLDAFEAWGTGKDVTCSWQLTLDTTQRWYPLVLQHLMLGMNAHINLDLGIAAAETSPGTELAGLKTDFDRINDVLIALVEEVQQELGQISPLFKLLDRFAGKLDEKIADKSMLFARDRAWAFAEEYNDSTDKASTLKLMDTKMTVLGRLLLRISFFRWPLFLFIRLAERGTVASRIQVLE